MSTGSCAKGRFPRATWACDNHNVGPSTLMKIAIASDHAGYRLKEDIKLLLRELGHEVRDFGTHSGDPVDYPDFVAPAAEAVSRGECEQGIVLGGARHTGAIGAHKIPRSRPARCDAL